MYSIYMESSYVFEMIGLIGAAAMGICDIPQAYQSIKQKHSDGISLLSLSLWGFGDIALIVFTLGSLGFVWPILLSYLFNFSLLCIILWYAVFPKKKKVGRPMPKQFLSPMTGLYKISSKKNRQKLKQIKVTNETKPSI